MLLALILTCGLASPALAAQPSPLPSPSAASSSPPQPSPSPSPLPAASSKPQAAVETKPTAASETPPPPPVQVSSATRDLWKSGVAIERIEGSVIHFKPVSGGAGKAPRQPTPLETGLHDILYLGAVHSPDALPVLLMIGRPCSNCSEEKQIYAVRVDGTRSTHFVFPGKILDPRSRAVLLESRAFYGRCLPKPGESYVVYQRERIDRRRALQTSVFVATPAKDFLEETLFERHLPAIRNTLQQVKKRQCWEILGRNRLMLRKQINLRPRRPGEGPDPNADEDEEDDRDADPAQEAGGSSRD